MRSSRIDEILANTNDFYKVLGVPRNADEKEICRSYRSLALCLHPDKNLGDEKAGEAFCAAGRAYSVLKDPTLRQIYDHGGVDAITGKENMDDLTLRAVIVMFAEFVAAHFLYAVARQGHNVEKLRERHNWVEHFVSWKPEDDFAYYWKASREESRRFVRKLFVRFLLTVFSLIIASAIFGKYSGESNEETNWDPYYRLFQSSNNETGASFIVCSSGGGNMTDVTAWRPLTISEEDAKVLIQKWIHEFCPVELLLSWASRERYKPTATLHPMQDWKVVSNQSFFTLRRRWESKFKESFSLRFVEELHVASPLCDCFLK